jgi:hypothetical protein
MARRAVANANANWRAIMEQYEYMSENLSGNLHDVASTMNKTYAKDGWRVVAIDRTPYYSVVLMERKLPKSDFENFSNAMDDFKVEVKNAATKDAKGLSDFLKNMFGRKTQ